MTSDQDYEAVLMALVTATTEIGEKQDAAASSLPDNLLRIVDSFAFVQLFVALEERLGVHLDLENVDLDDLTRPVILIKFLRGQMNTDPAIAGP